MDRVEFSINAKKDLNEIKENDPAAVAMILATYSQMKLDPNLQDLLLERYRSEDGINISRWISQYKRGNDLYRLKWVDFNDSATCKYRVIYAYKPISIYNSEAEYRILAIVHRDKFDYTDENEYTKRIIEDYRNL